MMVYRSNVTLYGTIGYVKMQSLRLASIEETRMWNNDKKDIKLASLFSALIIVPTVYSQIKKMGVEIQQLKIVYQLLFRSLTGISLLSKILNFNVVRYVQSCIRYHISILIALLSIKPTKYPATCSNQSNQVSVGCSCVRAQTDRAQSD